MKLSTCDASRVLVYQFTGNSTCRWLTALLDRVQCVYVYTAQLPQIEGMETNGMKRHLIVSLTCWLVIALHQARANESPLQLSNATLPPMTLATGEGFLDRIAKELFDRAGLKFELLKLPSARGLAMANAGSLDGELARININPDLFSNLQLVPDSLIDVLFAGLYTRPGINVKTLDDFRLFRVGYIRGWVIAESLFAEHPNAVATNGVKQLLDMLEADRIDIAFMTVAPGRYLAKNRGIGKLGITDFRMSKGLFLYLHEKHAAKIPALSKALRSMKEDGTHEALLREYRLEYQ